MVADEDVSSLKVLILSQHFWPETFRINEVAVSLRESGCNVAILTGQPNYPDGKIFPGYKAVHARIDRYNGISVYRVPLIPRGKGGALRLTLNYISFIVTACTIGIWLLRRKRFDTVFVYGTSPILQAIPAIIFGKLKRARVVVWVQDLWPDSLEATGFVRNRLALSAVGIVVRWIYQHSDLLLAQSHAFVTSVAAMAGRTTVLYHPNPGERVFQSVETGTAKVVLEPGFNILFAGNLGTVQALDTILDAAEQLRDVNDLRFVLAGSGSRSTWLAQELVRRKLENVSLLGRLPPEAMPGLLSQASVLLVTLARSPILGQTVPSKVQAYLAAGKPIIASLDGEGARLVEEAAAGMSCPAEDASALAQACRKLYSASPEDRERIGRAGRCFFEKHFDPDMLASRLAKLLGQPTGMQSKARGS